MMWSAATCRRFRSADMSAHSKKIARLNTARFGGCFGVISPDTISVFETRDCESYPQHECGLFGVFGHPNAAVLTYYGLFALQHRGQESAGIVTTSGPDQTFLQHKGMGLV